MATKHQVLDYFRAHPKASSTQIAAALGCESGYVRATLQRANVKLANAKGWQPKAPLGPEPPRHDPEDDVDLAICADLDAGLSMAEIARAHGVNRNRVARNADALAQLDQAQPEETAP